MIVKCRCGFSKDIKTKEEFIKLEKQHNTIYCYFGGNIKNLNELLVLL